MVSGGKASTTHAKIQGVLQKQQLDQKKMENQAAQQEQEAAQKAQQQQAQQQAAAASGPNMASGGIYPQPAQ